MLVGERGSDLMVPRIAMMKALQREATAAFARAGNAPRPAGSFADASCSASLASAPTFGAPCSPAILNDRAAPPR
jgi:hypothetical protein